MTKKLLGIYNVQFNWLCKTISLHNVGQIEKIKQQNGANDDDLRVGAPEKVSAPVTEVQQILKVWMSPEERTKGVTSSYVWYQSLHHWWSGTLDLYGLI